MFNRTIYFEKLSREDEMARLYADKLNRCFKLKKFQQTEIKRAKNCKLGTKYSMVPFLVTNYKFSLN